MVRVLLLQFSLNGLKPAGIFVLPTINNMGGLKGDFRKGLVFRAELNVQLRQ